MKAVTVSTKFCLGDGEFDSYTLRNKCCNILNIDTRKLDDWTNIQNLFQIFAKKWSSLVSIQDYSQNTQN